MFSSLPLDKLIFGLIMDVFVLAILIVCILEIRRYFKKLGIISGQQLIVRIIGGIFLMILMLQIQYGIYFVDPDPGEVDYFISYWSRCLIVTFLFVITGLVDLYYTMQLRRQARRVMKGVDHAVSGKAAIEAESEERMIEDKAH